MCGLLRRAHTQPAWHHADTVHHSQSYQPFLDRRAIHGLAVLQGPLVLGSMHHVTCYKGPYRHAHTHTSLTWSIEGRLPGSLAQQR